MQQPAKKPKLKNLRNVLKNPFAIKWCEKTLDEVFPVHSLLKEALPLAKLEETEQRIKFNKRKEVSRNFSSKKRSPNINRTYLAIGFNHVIRSLERGDLCCILVANDIQPPLLTKTLLAHVLGSGQWTGSGGSVPVLILPELRNIARSTLGYAAMTIGLKNIATNPDNIFNPVYKFVSQNPTILETQLLMRMQEEEQSSDKVQPNVKNDEIKPIEVLDFKPENVYLYRKTIGERVFIPENTCEVDVSTSDNVLDDFVSFEGKPTSSKDASDFLSFGDNPTASRLFAECSKEKSNSFDWKKVQVDYDDDDDSAGEEAADNFFIDSKPDDSLIKSFEKEAQNYSENRSKTGTVIKKTPKLQPGISRMFQASPARTKDISKFKGKKMKKEQKNKVEVNYQPLKLKSITGNIKRTHRKTKL